MKKYKLSREINFGGQIVFTDGLSGSGKNVLFHIINTLDRVETVRLDHIYEYLCAMKFLNRIENDVLDSLMQLNMDLALNNVMLSRQVNFRPTDVSSVLISPKKDIYLSRLFEPEGNLTYEKINREKPILHFASHSLLGISKPLLKVFEERITLIEIERSPLYLVPAWVRHIERYGTDPFELTVGFQYRNKDLPWFSAGWEENYVNSNTYDKTIRAYKFFKELKDTFFADTSKSINNSVLQIPFEKFVTIPWAYVEKIEQVLQVTQTKHTEKVMLQQNIPRSRPSDIPSHESYHKYGNYPIDNNVTEDKIKQGLWDIVHDNATPDCVKILEELVLSYNAKYKIN